MLNDKDDISNVEILYLSLNLKYFQRNNKHYHTIMQKTCKVRKRKKSYEI